VFPLNRLILALVLCALFIFQITVAQSTCGETVGTVVRETYSSSWLGQNMFYSVYMPPCYAQTTDVYPTVYLFHGSNDDDGLWGRLGMIDALDAGIASGELPPMLLMMPFGNVIANRNRFDNVSWGNIFLTEMMPDAEAKYRVDARPEGRVIAGISRGGFWSYQIGLRHPELFSAIAGHSGFFDLYHAEPPDNPLHLILDAPSIENMRFWIDRGKDDFAAPGLDEMDTRMKQRGLNYIYNLYPEGQHANSYWSQHVREYLDFYAAGWQSGVNVAATPTLVTVQFITATPDSAQGLPLFATNTPQGDAPPTTPDAVLPTIAVLPSVTPPPVTGEGIALYVPVVGFGSIQTSITSERLIAIAQGTLDERLIVTPEMLAALPMLNTGTRTVEAAALRNTLWRDRNLFTLLPFDALTTEYRMLWVDDVPIVDILATYPFAFASSTPNFDPAKLTRITFSGVTALARNTLTSLDANGVEWAASGIQSYVDRSDFFHMSNEVSFFETCPQLNSETLGGSSSMCSKPHHFELLKRLGVDVVELTGNHNNDYGYQAYLDTLNWYHTNGIRTVGGGATLAEARQPVILEHNGSTIGLVACNIPGPYYALVNESTEVLGGVRPGAATCDWAWLESELPQLAIKVDSLVVTIQYNEYEDYQPTNQQRFDYRRLAELGADIVLGTAEHKPMIYEFYGTERGEPALIHYGMSNLFFDQPFWGNMRFIMNTLYIYDGKVMTDEIFPGIIDDLARPRLMTPEERENFLFFLFVQQNGF
jgi:enterochelin esterase-like enzyme